MVLLRYSARLVRGSHRVLLLQYVAVDLHGESISMCEQQCLCCGADIALKVLIRLLTVLEVTHHPGSRHLLKAQEEPFILTLHLPAL